MYFGKMFIELENRCFQTKVAIKPVRSGGEAGREYNTMRGVTSRDMSDVSPRVVIRIPPDKCDKAMLKAPRFDAHFCRSLLRGSKKR